MNYIETGAVSLREDFEGTNSKNHHMFSDIGCCLMKYLAGITKTKDKITITPYLKPFNELSCTTDFGNGKVTISYQSGTIQITIPPNTTAELFLNNKTYPLCEGINIITAK